MINAQPVTDRRAPGTHGLLGVDVPDLHAVTDVVLSKIASTGESPAALAALRRALVAHADKGPDDLHHTVAVVHEPVRAPCPELSVLVRLAHPMSLEDDDGQGTRFVWFLFTRGDSHEHLDAAAEFSHQLGDPEVLAAALAATDGVALEAVYARALDDELHFQAHLAPELRPTGQPFGALRADVTRRLATYVDDWRDGLTTKAVGSTLFLYFACLAPSVAFGGLLSVLTNGEFGVVETLIGTAISGVLYALLAGQPLSILGSTGPVTIFLGILYGSCATLGLPFLPTLWWVGLWTSVFLVAVVAVDGASYIRFFTRFTDDTFAALISVIFIGEALSDMAGVFDGGVERDTALLSLGLAVGTYLVATQLSQFRRSVYLRPTIREFFADFGPTIAIFAMTAVAFWLQEAELATLPVPDSVRTTSGRGWIVDPTEAPRWVWIGAAIPATLGAILVYLDHSITIRLVNNPTHRLQRGGGYHLDLLVVAGLVLGLSTFGLPWTVAATVRSLNHVRSLATTEVRQGTERIVGVVETRLTGLTIHVLIGASLLALPLLAQVPMSVLFGLFLFMGVASMKGNQLFERLQLWVTDPKRYPPLHYLRAVPTRVVHRYTLIQAAALGALLLVKSTPAGIVFPLFIALLVPVRMAIGGLFKPEHMALLDADEVPSDDQYSETE